MVHNISVDSLLENVTRAHELTSDPREELDFRYSHHIRLELLPACLLPFLIVGGLVCNIMAFAVLLKRRLYLDHEGFVYLAAIQLINIAVLVYELTPFWIASFNHNNNIMITSDASCRALIVLDHVLSSASGWLVVAMLFGVYIRRRRSETDDEICGGCCCTDFSAKYCTLFGAGFTTGSIFFQLVVGCLWLIPFTGFLELSIEQFCYGDLPWKEYAAWVFFVERSPLLVLTPVLLIALAYLSLNDGRTLGRGGGTSGEDSLNLIIEESRRSNADHDFSKAAVGVAAASILLKWPLVITKSLMSLGDVHHLARFDVLFFGLNFLSQSNLVVMPIVCLATLSGMREAITSMTKGKCSESCRCLGRTSVCC